MFMIMIECRSLRFRTRQSRSEIQRALGLKGQANFRSRYLLPALANGPIAMIIRDKPRSRMQKHRLSGKGRNLLRCQE